MATMIAVGDIIELKNFSAVNDQVGINVTHWKVASKSAGAFLEAMADVIQPIFQGWYNPIQTVDVFNYGCTVRRAFPFATASMLPSGAATPGGVAAAVMPGQVSGICTVRTAFAGRANRGRFYPPFLPETFSDGTGLMNATGFGAMTTFAAFFAGLSLVVPMGGETCTISIGVTNKFGTPFVLANNVIARPRFASQRRRGQTGRPNTIPPF